MKKQKLKTQTDTPKMGDRVLGAAEYKLGTDNDLRSFFERWQWWVEDLETGAQYSVVDAEGLGSYDGFDFEQVTSGDAATIAAASASAVAQ